jgi:hypothetical protein
MEATAHKARTRASALMRPLGRYMRDADVGVTALLALHRLVSDTAFWSPLWTRPGTELLLRRRLRPTLPRPSRA